MEISVDYAHLEIGFYDNQDILAHREYFAELGISAADLKSDGSHTFLSRFRLYS